MVNFNVDRSILTDVLVAHGKHPGLGPPFTQSGRTRLHGQLEVFDGQGIRWGGFTVSILFPSEYPHAPPILFENQGRIKREADWHVNNDGSLCLGPEVSELRKYMGRAHLLDWIDRSAIPFLTNHLYKERTGGYLNGEYSHGAKGVWEYYVNEWRCAPAEVLRRLELLSGAKVPSRKERCFCGSGLTWRSCHGVQSEYEGVPNSVYANDLKRLRRSTPEAATPH